MLPLYVLFSLPKAYDRASLFELWPLLLSPLILVPILFLLGLLSSWLINLPRGLHVPISSVFAFSSIGNIGILMGSSTCSSFGPIKNTSDQCSFMIPYLCMTWLSFNIVMFLLAVPALYLESGTRTEPLSTTLFRYLLLPLPVAAVVANIIGLIPGAVTFFFDKDSVGFMFTDSAHLIGYCGIMFSQIIVGSTITLNVKETSELGWKVVAWVVLCRNLVVSAVVLGYVWLLWTNGLFYGDKVMAFAVFIGLAGPPSFMILLMMENFAMPTQETLLVILWVFITAPVTITASSYILFTSILVD
jgi:hypothetical protein